MAYEEYKRNFEEDPPRGETLMNAFRWGNLLAARDIEMESPEVQKEVDDYVSKYNAGVVRTVEEYRALRKQRY